MNKLTSCIAMCLLFLFLSTYAFGESQPIPLGSQPKVSKKIYSKQKFSQKKPHAFQVREVKFEKIALNNQFHLAVAVIFNRPIDASTVQQNVNIRLLRKNQNNYWVDASTQNNIVNVRPSHITWVSGAPLTENGHFVMHLRGTIKSKDGLYLDCDGDGKGEGGSLPPYESQIYQVNVGMIPELSRELEERN